jgi:polyisoprenoid-binding protein YceI
MTTKNNFKIGRILIIAVAALMSIAANAQTARKASSFQIKLNGTSNLHDWTMNASSGTIDANLNLASNVNYLAGIQSLTFTMPVKNLKSTEGSLMDSRAYDALKADKYTTMTFKLLTATPASTQGNKTQFNVTGLLTIAGVTKQVNMSATAVKNADGSIVISGNQKLKMTDFGIKPPSFMFGALRTGDNLSIDYTVHL